MQKIPEKTQKLNPNKPIDQKLWNEIGKLYGYEASNSINFKILPRTPHDIITNPRILLIKYNVDETDRKNVKEYSNRVNEIINKILSTKANFNLNMTNKMRYFINKSELSPYFDDIYIEGDGNCMFNTIAWWFIHHYYTLNNRVSFGNMDDNLKSLMTTLPVIRRNPENIRENVSYVSSELRKLVCGFYATFTPKIPSDDDTRIVRGYPLRISIDFPVYSLFQINSEITTEDNDSNEVSPYVYKKHKKQICNNREWGRNQDLGLLSYIFKINIAVFRINGKNGNFVFGGEIPPLSIVIYECGEANRPYFWAYNSTTHYNVLYPKDATLKPTILNQ